MEITVNEQPQRFYLALDKWEGAVGHEIKVGGYRFCAIPLSNSLNVSEVTSGAKLLDIPLTLGFITATKEDSLKLFEKVGKLIKQVIEGSTDFDKRLKNMKKIAFEQLGEMPPIEDVDINNYFGNRR